MTSKCPFAIVTSQRTGSTLLVRSIDTSPDVFCAGEIFHTGFDIHHAEFRFPRELLGSRILRRAADMFARRRRVEAHIQHYYAVAGEGALAVGFKVMASQLRELPEIMPFLKRLDARLFYLYRRDTFATAMSYYKATVSGVFHSNQARHSGLAHPVIADPAEFDTILKICERNRRALCDLQAAYGGRILIYEDMVHDWDRFIDDIGLQLGLPGLRVPQVLSRVGSGEDALVVENEDELRATFTPRADAIESQRPVREQ